MKFTREHVTLKRVNDRTFEVLVLNRPFAVAIAPFDNIPKEMEDDLLDQMIDAANKRIGEPAERFGLDSMLQRLANGENITMDEIIQELSKGAAQA